MTVAAAVAVVRVVERHSDAKPSIKWVNDVYIGDKKVCGILTEAVSDFESGMLEAAVVGVGLNVRKTDLPKALAGVAGYVPGLAVSRNQLIAEIALEIAGLAENLRDPALMEEYRAHSLVLGRKVRWQQDGEWYTGRAAAIDDRGGLLIETGGDTVRLAAGEVSVLPEPLV